MSDNTPIQTSRQIKRTNKSLDNKALGNCVETLGLAKNQHQIFTYADHIVAHLCSK
jgi:hypothetical protein